MSGHTDRHSVAYNPHATHSLPSINDLTNGLRRCRVSTCPKLVPHGDVCSDHEHRMSISQQLSEFNFPQDPFRQVAPMKRQVHHRLPSPVSVSSHEDGSSESDHIYTPDVSRNTSPVTSTRAANARRASKVAARRDSRRPSVPVTNVSCVRRESLPANTASQLDKKVKKMQKEKNCRGAQAGVSFRSEDTFLVYTGWQRKEQSGGNGNGAGLFANKINIQRGIEVLSQRLLHRGRTEALKCGPAAVREFERDMMELLDGAAEADPYEGTFLEPLGRQEPCRSSDPKSKGCVTHGSPDWIECRKARALHCYQTCHANWMQQNLTTAQIEAHRRAGTA